MLVRYTKELGERYLDLVRRGLSRGEACRELGIGVDSVLLWSLDRGFKEGFEAALKGRKRSLLELSFEHDVRPLWDGDVTLDRVRFSKERFGVLKSYLELEFPREHSERGGVSLDLKLMIEEARGRALDYVESEVVGE